MKRYTIIIGRVNQDVMMHVNQFFKEASLIERVKLDKDTLSVNLEDGKKDSIIALAKKLKMVDFINP